MSKQNTIVLIGSGIRKERIASAAVRPGDILALASTNKVAPHGTAGASVVPWIAIEDEIHGNDLNHNYANNDNVLIEHLGPGCVFQAWVDDGTAAIAVGALLMSDGAGGVAPVGASDHTTSAQRGGVRFRALEALDNSAGTKPLRIAVEVI